MAQEFVLNVRFFPGLPLVQPPWGPPKIFLEKKRDHPKGGWVFGLKIDFKNVSVPKL